MSIFSVQQIAVGSTNPVKVAAVANVLKQLGSAALVRGIEVDSGVRGQPLSDDEAIAGARNRARQALLLTEADLGIGVEGNTTESPYGMFVTGWAVAIDRHEVTGVGGSGRFLLPAMWAEKIRHGAELGDLMDQLAGEQQTKHRQGAIGIFTNGALTRTDALETAVLFALTRWIHPDYYT